MHYFVTNEISKEFAIVEPEILSTIVTFQDEHGREDIYHREMDDNENWDQLIENESSKGYRYAVLDDEDDIHDFVLNS